MSQVDTDLAQMFEEIDSEAKRKQELISELNEKKLDLEVYRTEQKYQQMRDSKQLQEDVKNLEFSLDDPNYVDRLVQTNTRYMETVRHKSMVFLNETFKGVVPYMPNNLILVGARSGRGKSTTCANLCYQAVMKSKKVFVASNEEKANDVFNRVTSLVKGVAYTEHDKLTPEQVTELNEYIKLLSKRMMVIDDDITGKVGGMGMLELIQGYITKAVESKQYDVIIIDYYQKVNESIDNAYLDEYQVQGKFAYFLGDLLKHPDCPAIVVMVQLKPDDKDTKRPIEDRVEGRKLIIKPATCILEAKPDYERRCTAFVVHKSRWSENNGKEFDVGYMRGKYVLYNNDFKEYVEREKTEEVQRKALRTISPKNNFNGD